MTSSSASHSLDRPAENYNQIQLHTIPHVTQMFMDWPESKTIDKNYADEMRMLSELHQINKISSSDAISLLRTMIVSMYADTYVNDEANLAKLEESIFNKKFTGGFSVLDELKPIMSSKDKPYKSNRTDSALLIEMSSMPPDLFKHIVNLYFNSAVKELALTPSNPSDKAAHKDYDKHLQHFMRILKMIIRGGETALVEWNSLATNKNITLINLMVKTSNYQSEKLNEESIKKMFINSLKINQKAIENYDRANNLPLTSVAELAASKIKQLYSQYLKESAIPEAKVVASRPGLFQRVGTERINRNDSDSDSDSENSRFLDARSLHVQRMKETTKKYERSQQSTTIKSSATSSASSTPASSVESTPTSSARNSPRGKK